VVAGGQGTAPLIPGLAGIMVGEEFGRLVGLAPGQLDPMVRRAAVGAGAGGLADGAHQQGEEALHLEEGPAGGPAEGATRPYTASPTRTYVQQRYHGRLGVPIDHLQCRHRYSRCMTVRELLAELQLLPRDAELLAVEAGCEEYCEREVDEVEGQGDRVYLHLGARRDDPPRR
jgi:hypothetical protein